MTFANGATATATFTSRARAVMWRATDLFAPTATEPANSRNANYNLSLGEQAKVSVERTVGALETDMANVKDVLFGKGEGRPGLEIRVDKMEKTMMRMETVWDSIIGLGKIVMAVVGFAVVVCELIRAIEPLLHH